MTEETEKMPGAIDEAGMVRAAGDGQREAVENSAAEAGEAAKDSAGDPATVEAEADAEDGGNVEEAAREAAEEALPELLRQKIARLEERLAGLEAGAVREAGSAMHGGWQKGHLSSVVPAMGRDETVSVPRAEMAMLRDCFPDKTDGEIAELYRETVG